MRAPSHAAMRVAAALLLASTGIAHAAAPGLKIDLGKTSAISGPIRGGGVSLGLGAMWRVDDAPWELPIRFGVMAYWDDMGTRIQNLTDGSGTYLGLTAGPHQSAFGGAFRLDWEPALKTSWRPYASGTWGYYRVENDVRGGGTGGVSAPGFSLGAGIGHRLYEGHSIGAVVRYHRLFDDVTGRYVSGAVEWGWQGAGSR